MRIERLVNEQSLIVERFYVGDGYDTPDEVASHTDGKVIDSDTGTFGDLRVELPDGQIITVGDTVYTTCVEGQKFFGVVKS